MLVSRAASASRRSTSATRRTRRRWTRSSRPTSPKGGWWQNEDMEIDTRRKLIIGSLDPRHTDDADQRTCPANGSTSNPGCRSGFYVISYANPKNLKQIGDFVDAAVGPHVELHPEVPLPLDRRPGAAQRPGLARADPHHAARPRRRPPDLGHRPARPASTRSVSDQPIDLWRNDGYTDYSHDVDEDDKGIAWISGRGGIRGYATKGKLPRPVPEPRARGDPVRPDPRGRRRRRGDGPAGDVHAQLRPPDRRRGPRHRRQEGQHPRSAPRRTSRRRATPAGRIVASDLTDSWGGEPAPALDGRRSRTG